MNNWPATPKAIIRLLTTEEGGRTNGAVDGVRSQLKVGDVLTSCAVRSTTGVEVFAPGIEHEVVFEMMLWGDYDALIDYAEPVVLMEGSRVVGKGRYVQPVAVPVRKNLGFEFAVPTIWRPALKSIVEALIKGDTEVEDHSSVVLLDIETVEHAAAYIADYGDVTLVPLTEHTWDTSIAAWMGNQWEVLVDLWTAEEGRSDLVLAVSVEESGPGFIIELQKVYVP